MLSLVFYEYILSKFHPNSKKSNCSENTEEISNSFQTFFQALERLFHTSSLLDNAAVLRPLTLFLNGHLHWFLFKVFHCIYRVSLVFLFFSMLNIKSNHAVSLILHPLKTSENQRFTDVFRGYKKKPVSWNEWRKWLWFNLTNIGNFNNIYP